MNDAPVPLHDAGHEPDDETVRLLRRALTREAEMVEPRDGMEDIRRRTAGQDQGQGGGRRWVPWAAAVAAAAVVGLVVGGIVGTDDEEPLPAATGTTDPTPTSQPTTTPPTTTSPTSSESTTDAATGVVENAPVYWVGPSKTSFWLYREFRDVPDLGDPVTSAVAAMTREEPLDPDYMNPWQPAERVEVTRDGDAITVDLSADAFSGTDVGSELAALALQQLVYTATAAAQSDGPVTVLVDGEPAEVWGVLEVGEPIDRAPQVDVQASTWIIEPEQGQTVSNPVHVVGYGTAFEATFNWEVRDAGTDQVVQEGFVTGEGSMGTYGDFEFTLDDLAPGGYVLEVYQGDMSDGESPEGPRMYPDTKEFTVD